MKLLSTYRPTVPQRGNSGPGASARAEAPATARAVPTRRPRLPRDSTVQFNTSPAELYIHITLSKMEHLDALMEALKPSPRNSNTRADARRTDHENRICTLARLRHLELGDRRHSLPTRVSRFKDLTGCLSGDTKTNCRSSRNGSSTYTSCR